MKTASRFLLGLILLCMCIPICKLIGQTDPQLTLEIKESDAVELSWPYTELQHELESSQNLSPDSWSTVNEDTLFVENRYRVATEYTGGSKFFRLRQLPPPLAQLASSSPSSGSGGVAISRETVLRFSTPLAEGTKLTGEEVYAEFAGERLSASIVLSKDRKSITLFYEEYLPAGSRIKVTIIGDLLTDIAGRAVDVDGDGAPGGTGSLEFTTLNVSPIQGTAVVGHVYATELGMENGQPVDVPLKGVMVLLDGKENEINATTDADGYFKLGPVPAGEFFVHIYGWTAEGSNYPDGQYYAAVGKSWTAIPGREDNLAGETGKIYLPLIYPGTLQPVSETEDTVIEFIEPILQQHQELAGVSITVPADSLFHENGTRGGKVGIAPVPPDRLPSPLPENLQFPVVITVQTDGGLNFDVPAPVRFPNLPDPVTGEILQPGAKTGLWSFDHDAGKWVLQGSMTISEDGLFAISDPGIGITAPGWHGVNPDGDGDEGGGGPKDDDDDDDPDKPDPDPNGNPDPCEKTGNKAMVAGAECLGSFITAIPIFGCGTSIAAGVAGSVANCNVDFDSCDQAVISETAATLLGCIPVYGGVAGIAYNCLYGGALALSEHHLCQFNQNLSDVPPPFTLQNFSTRAVDIPMNGYQEQAELWAAAAAFYEIVYGDKAWTLMDPEEWPIAEPFFAMLTSASSPGSEEGKGFSAAEKAILEALPRPSNITEEIVMATVDRIDRMNRSQLTAVELDSSQLQAALDNLVEIVTELESRGWTDLWDGLLVTLKDLMDEQDQAFNEQVAEGGNSASNHIPGFGKHYTQRGFLFYRITNLSNGFVQQGRLDEGGKFDGQFLAANTYYQIDYADPFAREVSLAVFKSGGPGTTTRIPRSILVEDDSPDSDGDGLSDMAETIIGSNPLDPDSDDDGYPDGVEIANGTNPLDGIALPASIISSIELKGRATAVDVTENIAVLARGLDGIGIVDISNPLSPRILSDLPVVDANVRFVGAWRNRVMATGFNTNVYFVNIRDPENPVLTIKENQIIGNCVGMFVYGPFGYIANSNNRLHKVDLRTHEVLWSETVGQIVQDVQVSRGIVYLLTTQNLEIYRDSGEGLELLGSVTVTGAAAPLETGTKLFVGGDYAYQGYFRGYSVIDISNPATPMIVGTPPETQLAVHDLVTSGSGHRLVATSNGGETTLKLTVYEGSDPSVVNSAVTDFDTPGYTRSVVMHQGLALVSDTEEDMQIINFLGQDPLNEPPTLTIETPFESDNMIVENDAVTWLYVDVSDNHLVRKADLYLDGKLYSSDGNFPFEFVYIPPALTENKDSFTAKVRATDMDGLLVESEELVINVVDTIPPILFDFFPGAGSYRYEEDAVNRVFVIANEPLDVLNINNASMVLIEAGSDGTFDTADDVDLPGTVSFNSDTLELSLALNKSLSKGHYRATVSSVTDISGNVLSDATSWMFDIRIPNQWIANTGGIFGTGSNWSEGGIRDLDRLIIDVPGDPENITYNSGTYSIESMQSEENFILDGRVFNISSEAVVNGLFTWTGQSTLDGGGVLRANGGLAINSTGSNKWIRNIQVLVDGSSTWINGSILFMELGSLLHYTENSTLEIMNDNFVNLVSSASDYPAGLINDGSFIKKGPGEFRINLPFQHNGTLDIQEGTFEVYDAKMTGPGTITVRSGGTFAAHLTTTFDDRFPLLETPLVLEDGGTLSLRTAYLRTADGIGITGNGIIALGKSDFYNTGSTFETNGDIVSEQFNFMNSSSAILDGTTHTKTVLMEADDEVGLSGTGVFEISEALIWNYGYMTGGGITKLLETTTTNINQDFGLGLGDRTLEIYGEFIAEGGFMRLVNAKKATIQIMPGATWRHQNDFQFLGTGATGYVDWFIINEGTYTKEGDVGITQNRINLENRGTLNLDYGFMRADFRFIQTEDGVVNLPVQSAPGTDMSNGSISFGNGFLDGTLNIQLAEGFVPEIGAQYTIFAGSSIEGTFASVNGLEIAADRKFELEYWNDRRVYLNVVAIP